MADTRISPAQQQFIESQNMFFVATAPSASDGHVNLSPKGVDGSLVVVDDQGSTIDGDCLLALGAKSLLDQKRLAGNTVVATVMSNLSLDQTKLLIEEFYIFLIILF